MYIFIHNFIYYIATYNNYSSLIFLHTMCVSCSAVLCQPTGGRARLTEGCSFRKHHSKYDNHSSNDRNQNFDNFSS